MPKALREESRSFRAKLGAAFGGLLFPSESDPETPVRRDVLAKWLQQAERRAGLKKLDGSLWHAYRRAWATSRKELRPPTLLPLGLERCDYAATVLPAAGPSNNTGRNVTPAQNS